MILKWKRSANMDKNKRLKMSFDKCPIFFPLIRHIESPPQNSSKFSIVHQHLGSHFLLTFALPIGQTVWGWAERGRKISCNFWITQVVFFLPLHSRSGRRKGRRETVSGLRKKVEKKFGE
jgi:hypothetical protein